MINILCLLMRVAQTVNSLHLRLPGGAAGARGVDVRVVFACGARKCSLVLKRSSE